MVIPFYPNLTNNWEDYELLEEMIPKKRVRKYKRWYHGRTQVRVASIKAEKILEMYIGKPFKDAYAKFMTSAKYDSGWKPIKKSLFRIIEYWSR